MTEVDFWTTTFFLFAIAIVALTGAVFGAIKREDPNLWQELGAPSLLQVNAQIGVYKFWAWVFSAKRVENKLSMTTMGLISVLRFGTVLFLAAFAFMVVRVFVK